MKTLYVTDLDGTLLGSDSRVSARSAEIISSLTRQGAMISVATARTPATVVPLLADTATVSPLIVMTGAALWMRDRGEFMNARRIDSDKANKAIEICRNMGVNLFVYTLESPSMMLVYHEAAQLSPREQEFYKDRCHSTLKRFVLATKAPADARVILCYGMGRSEIIAAAAEALKQVTGLSISCYPDIFDHDYSHLEFYAAGVSKADALLEIKNMLGAERVVAFGDNLNDLPILRVADCAVAVGNAFDAVKEMADYVIGPNTEDSVAKFIKSDFENNN